MGGRTDVLVTGHWEDERIAILRSHDQKRFKFVPVPDDQSVDFDKNAATRRWLDPHLGHDWHLAEIATRAGAQAIVSLLADRARSMEGREAVLEEADGWQPIETAPEDHKDLLLASSGSDQPPFVAGWVEDAMNWMNYDGKLCPFIPTHWRPLPKQPVARPDHGGGE